MKKRLTKNRSLKKGLPPGSLVHVGNGLTGSEKITMMVFDEASLSESVPDSLDFCTEFKKAPAVTWINIEGPPDPEIMERFGACYGFHPLMLEDILNTDQRPKVEDYSGYMFVVLKMLGFNDASGQIVPEQISLILGDNYLISFQEGAEGDTFEPVRERIRADRGRIRKSGPDYLLYSLMDSVVDCYFSVLEKLGERIEAIEENLVETPAPETLRDLHALKREMIYIRKAVWPLREVIGTLERGESRLIRETTRVYLRDVHDHSVQVIDTVETFRDMLSGMLDIYLSSVSNRLNEVMKVLTLLATIFMPLTFIAGIYGMNFKNMPETRWEYGYYAALGVMLLIAGSMAAWFKKKNWF